MSLLDEVLADVRPISRRVNMAGQRYSALCIALYVLVKEVKLDDELLQEALCDVADFLDGQSPSTRSGLAAIPVS